MSRLLRAELRNDFLVGLQIDEVVLGDGAADVALARSPHPVLISEAGDRILNAQAKAWKRRERAKGQTGDPAVQMSERERRG